MRKFAAVFFLCFVSTYTIQSAGEQNPISIIPQPVKLEIKQGTFTFENETKIWIDQSGGYFRLPRLYGMHL